MSANGRNGRAEPWTEDEALQAGTRYVERYGEPPTATVFNPSKARLVARRAHAAAAERLARLDELAERFERDGDYPGQAVILDLFSSFDEYLDALGFTPRGVGRTAAAVRRAHVAEAELTAEERTILRIVKRIVVVEAAELIYQAQRVGVTDPLATADELAMAGLLKRSTTYRLTPEGQAMLEDDEDR